MLCWYLIKSLLSDGVKMYRKSLAQITLVITCVMAVAACGSGNKQAQQNPISSTASSNMSEITTSSFSSTSSSELASSLSTSLSSSISSSSLSSSSQSPTNSIDLTYVFPTQNAHLGGLEETHIKLRMGSDNQNIIGVSLGGIDLIQKGDYWESQNTLNLDNSDDQEFLVDVLLESGVTQPMPPLILHNSGSGVVSKAGLERGRDIQSIAFNKNNSALYATIPSKAKVIAVEKNGNIQTLYQAKPSSALSTQVRWPITIDDESSKLYFIEDQFEFQNIVGSEAHNFVLHQLDINTGKNIMFCDSNASNELRRINTAINLISDFDKVSSASLIAGESRPILLSLDTQQENGLQRWVLDIDTVDSVCNLATTPVLFSPKDADGRLTPSHNLSAFTFNKVKNEFYFIKEFSKDNARGEPVLLKTNEQEAALGTVNIVSEKWIDLGGIVNKPTALLLSNDSDFLYIADSFKIWSVNIETQAINLISSSNKIPEFKGEGVDLTGTINSMVMHPEDNILYITTGSQGIVAIDLETGNRIAVLK